MGWAVGYDSNYKRDVGYGIPSYCDHPDCDEVIDRGLAYVCGGEPYGGEEGEGCGLFFCVGHQVGSPQSCERCRDGKEPFSPSPDHPYWVFYKLLHGSWEEWRSQNTKEVYKLEGIMEEFWRLVPKSVMISAVLKNKENDKI